MSTSMVKRVIGMAKERGFTFAVVGGQPVLRGERQFMTEPLRKAIAEFRPQIIDYLKLEVNKPAPASEPDPERNVRTMDSFGQTSVVVNFASADWKIGQVAWQYIGESGWRSIVGREDKFPAGVLHA